MDAASGAKQLLTTESAESLSREQFDEYAGRLWQYLQLVENRLFSEGRPLGGKSFCQFLNRFFPSPWLLKNLGVGRAACRAVLCLPAGRCSPSPGPLRSRKGEGFVNQQARRGSQRLIHALTAPFPRSI